MTDITGRNCNRFIFVVQFFDLYLCRMSLLIVYIKVIGNLVFYIDERDCEEKRLFHGQLYIWPVVTVEYYHHSKNRDHHSHLNEDQSNLCNWTRKMRQCTSDKMRTTLGESRYSSTYSLALCVCKIHERQTHVMAHLTAIGSFITQKGFWESFFTGQQREMARADNSMVK